MQYFAFVFKPIKKKHNFKKKFIKYEVLAKVSFLTAFPVH